MWLTLFAANAAASTTNIPSRWEFIIASYVVFAIVFIFLALSPIVKRKKTLQKIKAFYRRQEMLNEENGPKGKENESA